MFDRTTSPAERAEAAAAVAAVGAVTIRPAADADRDALRRLAALDSARVPDGRLLVADSGGELRAAVAIDSGAAIADPFHPTAGLVELLRARALQLKAPDRASTRRRARVVMRSLRLAD
jgi:hypothetical protein